MAPCAERSGASVSARSAIADLRHASATAAPFRSLPDEAAVADVFGTLSVRVGMTRTRSGGTPRASAATWRILVKRPCPISVPP